jgi:hypothetical protein
MDAAVWRQVLEKNELARKQLAERLEELTDAELSCPMEAGWTVSAVLAHLAFWDVRAYALIGKWKETGVGPLLIDTDVINEVARVLCLAIPPRVAVKLLLDEALALDHQLEGLSPEMVEVISTVGTTVHLVRYPHRLQHLEEIEKALAMPA